MEIGARIVLLSESKKDFIPLAGPVFLYRESTRDPFKLFLSVEPSHVAFIDLSSIHAETIPTADSTLFTADSTLFTADQTN